MTKHTFEPSILVILPVIAAIFAWSGPARSQPFLGSPQEASAHVDDLGREVYKVGNARKANLDLDEFCRNVNNKLRGVLPAQRSEWEVVARKCALAQKTMKEYNSGGTIKEQEQRERQSQPGRPSGTPGGTIKRE